MIFSSHNLSFEIFDMDFADPEDIALIFSRNRSWLINFHKKILSLYKRKTQMYFQQISLGLLLQPFLRLNFVVCFPL